MKNIEEKIKSILIDEFGIDEDQIEENSTFTEVGMDSMAIIELEYEIAKRLETDERKVSIQLDDSVSSVSNKLVKILAVN